MNERSKIIKLLINGNDQYKGKIISITKNRFVNFNEFLDQLTLYFKSFLPNGIRRVYRYGNFQMVHRLEELENYGCYICCSHERLKKMAYDSNFIDKAIFSQTEKRNFFNNKIERNSLINSIVPNYKIFREIEESREMNQRKIKENISPKLIKIVFSDKPQDIFKIFINRNLEISLNECLWKISNNLNRKTHKHDKIKIFTVSGREITNMPDLYINRSPILAFTNSMMMYPQDVKAMITSLFPVRHRAERYFAKWLIEEGSENSSVHSIRLKSSTSSTSETIHSKVLSARYLTNRENKIINQINDRKLEMEKLESGRSKDHHQDYADKIQGKDSIKENQTKENLKGVDKCTNMTPRFDHLDKGIQVFSDVRHFWKITEVRPNIAHSMKTDVSHNSKHSDKVTQFLPRINHFHKGMDIMPNLLHSLTEFHGRLEANTNTKDKAIQCTFDSGLLSVRSNNKNEKSFSNDSIFLTEKYQLINILSKSSRSIVYLTNDFKQNRFIVKQINLGNHGEIRMKEAQILMSCDHRNIIQCFEVYRSEIKVEIVMEYFPEGNLDKYLSKKEIYEKDIMKMVQDVGSGLLYLHTVGIIHRYIQPKNIYYQSNPQKFLIGNMGQAELKTENLIFIENWTQTQFMAPELTYQKEYNEKVDIWSLGVITGNIVCNKYEPKQAVEEFSMDMQHPNWINWSSDCQMLVTEMLQNDPSDRFNALQVLCHPWLTQSENREMIQEDLFREMESFTRQQIDTTIV